MTPRVGEAGDALKRLVQGAIAGALIAIYRLYLGRMDAWRLRLERQHQAKH